MKVYKQNPVRLVESELKTDMGSGNTIFVGSSCDCFADAIPDEWTGRMLEHLREYPKNTYLLQTKNPLAFVDWYGALPPKVIYGTTIETNRDYKVSKAPDTELRAITMTGMTGVKKLVSIEPVMDFDTDIFTHWIKDINPSFVSIGADSKGHRLPEPSPEKLKALIENLQKFTEVKIKSNLKRLL